MDDARRQPDAAYRDSGIGAVQRHRRHMFAVNRAWRPWPVGRKRIYRDIFDGIEDTRWMW